MPVSELEQPKREGILTSLIPRDIATLLENTQHPKDLVDASADPFSHSFLRQASGPFCQSFEEIEAFLQSRRAHSAIRHSVLLTQGLTLIKFHI
jgi:hypothetical protein